MMIKLINEVLGVSAQPPQRLSVTIYVFSSMSIELIDDANRSFADEPA